jgi:hypothetical protein
VARAPAAGEGAPRAAAPRPKAAAAKPAVTAARAHVAAHEFAEAEAAVIDNTTSTACSRRSA